MKKIILTIIALFIAIQFIPYGKEHSNPKIISEPKWDSPKTKEIFMRACGDCHSNETQYPWYSNIAPISWAMAHHIEEGREHFNISVWGHQEKNDGNEAVEEIQEGEMPLKSYLLAHPEARLTDSEKQLLIDGLKKTFGEKKEHH
jgi:mono/diheme cytochrome c family protein